MRVLYVAKDGSAYATEKECLEHEKTLGSEPVMFTWTGEETSYVDRAAIVYLGKYDNSCGNKFADMADEQGSAHDGIFRTDLDDEAFGWYYWDESTQEYRFIDDPFADAIKFWLGKTMKDVEDDEEEEDRR